MTDVLVARIVLVYIIFNAIQFGYGVGWDLYFAVYGR